MVGPLEALDTRLLVDLLKDRSKPKKSLGQHFLVDDEVIQRSVQLCEENSSALSKSCKVLEIGPGAGSLTLELLRTGARVSALEIDEESFLHLSRVFNDKECDLEVKLQDALSGSWPEGISHVISNLPYQISSPVLERIRKYHSSEPIKLCVILVQEEFAHRMAMTTPPYDVGPLGMNLWLDFEVLVDRRVSPNSFSPSPRVNSRLVVLRPLNRPEAEGVNKQLFRIITKHCFSNRRRKMRTLLSKTPSRISRVPGWHKDRWMNSTSKLLESGATGLEEGWCDLRPEILTPQNWASITRKITSE